MSIRFVHCSDLHLGAPYSMLPRAAADRRRVDQRQTLARIVDLALNKPEKADLMLISGDLFDSSRPSPRDVAFVRGQLQRLADGGVRTFIIPGNHDPYREGNFWSKADFPCTKLFTKTQFECVPLSDLDLCVCGIAPEVSFPTKNQLDLFGADISTSMSILLFHGSWLNFGRENADCHPFDIEDINGLPFDYIALGHYHAWCELEEASRKALYPGAPEAVGFSKNDLGDKFVAVGTIDREGVSIKKVQINHIRHIAEELDCTAESERSLRKKIEDLLGPSVYAHIMLTGKPSAELIAASEQFEQEFGEFCTFIDVETQFTSVGELPMDNVYFQRFVEKLNKKIENAPQAEKPLLNKALELGIRAFMKEG